MREKFLGYLAFYVYKALQLTWKIEIFEPASMIEHLKSNKPALLAHWHGDELGLVHMSRRYKIATLSSKSKDGEIMSLVLKKLGATVVRGSSSRAAVSGFLGLMRLIKKGHTSSFAVDGPKGPLHKAKAGVIEASKNLSVPIFCAGIAVDRAWIFEKSWNKAILPKPFAKVCIAWSEPLPIPPRDSDPNDPILLLKVENALYAAKQQALGIIARSTP